MALEDIRNERIRKLGLLRAAGREPYPAGARRTHALGDAAAKFPALLKSKKKLAVAGRVRAKREHGGSTFLDISDGTGSLQVYFREDVLHDDYRLALDTIDIGDLIGCEGRAFETKRGEPTLEVAEWRMLAKSLRPLPEKWHGLTDTEERFRRRYLDTLMNEEVKKRFEARGRIVETLRSLFAKEKFLEVETPMLHPIAGGALARPFVTHHNALDTDFYLRIAPELYLKRLLVGGFERVYELGKSFRNEGIDASHNPEFTMCECYAAWWNEEDMMEFVERTMLALAKIFGKRGATKKPFGRIAFTDILSRYAQITDYARETRDSLAGRARQFGIDAPPHESKGKIADEIYKKICRPYLTDPVFVTDHPVEISPLAKRREKTDVTRRFQLVAGGMELMNGFAELNDPLEQRERFEAQERERAGGEEEAMRLDEDFLEALEYGMPPAAGLGIGIDRLVMFFTEAKNIREAVLFPTMRPK